MERKVRVRFAPSPTGPLHIGGVRTALYNYLFAKKHNGDFLLRIEDTDQNRFVPGAEEYIVEALEWVGIKFDEGVHVGGPCAPYRQSERKDMYKQYAMQLIDSGFAYYAFDTADDLEAMREKLKAGNMLPQYDTVSRMSMKNSLTLSADDVAKRLENNEPYVIRMKLPRKEEVRFNDIIRGWVVVHTGQMDDKVLYKSDGMPTYHLANVVDDYLMKITHVIRGEEWLPSAPLHVMLYKYLGWEDVMPQFAHLPLLLKPEGNGKLSKRDGDRLGFPVFPLQWKDPATGETSSGYRESGYFPQAVVNLLALLGWHPSHNKEMFSMDELIEEFSLEKVSKSGAKFDLQKAHWFNHQYLRNATSEELLEKVKPVAENMGYLVGDDYLKKVIGLMSEKANFPKDIIHDAPFLFKAPTQFDEVIIAKKWNSASKLVIEKYSALCEKLNHWESTELESTFKNLCEQEGQNPSHLFQAMRLCIAGSAVGPPLFPMIELIGKEQAILRFNHACASLSVTQ